MICVGTLLCYLSSRAVLAQIGIIALSLSILQANSYLKNLENNTQKHRQNIKENAIGKIAFQAKTPLYGAPERHQSQYLTQRKATYNP